jgi:serine/threonine protein kinase
LTIFDNLQDNVLIDENGNPRLCDFGLSRMVEETSLWNTSATRAPGTFRWKAPELLSGEQRTVTTESDMYAFGMTCFVSDPIL